MSEQGGDFGHSHSLCWPVSNNTGAVNYLMTPQQLQQSALQTCSLSATILLLSFMPLYHPVYHLPKLLFVKLCDFPTSERRSRMKRRQNRRGKPQKQRTKVGSVCTLFRPSAEIRHFSSGSLNILDHVGIYCELHTYLYHKCCHCVIPHTWSGMPW